MDSITIIKDQQMYNTKIIKELIKLNNTKPIQPSPSRSITSIKCQLNKHIPPILSLTISKPKLNVINILNQSHNITIPNKYSKPITYTTSPTSKSAFPSPIILFAIKNNLLYNSKIKYVFNSKTNNYELRHYHNNKVNWKTFPVTHLFLLLSIGANSSTIAHALICDKQHLIIQYIHPNILTPLIILNNNLLYTNHPITNSHSVSINCEHFPTPLTMTLNSKSPQK